MDDTLRRGLQGQDRPKRLVAGECAGALLLIVCGIVGACGQPTSLTAVERGRRVYLANCITCHNPDPTRPGSAGPDIAGATRALLEARVLHGTYPSGYTPKRTTHAMVALPHLAQRIDDLAAYLAAPEG